MIQSNESIEPTNHSIVAIRDHKHTIHTKYTTHSQHTSIVYFKLNQFTNTQVVFLFEKCNSKPMFTCAQITRSTRNRTAIKRGKITIMVRASRQIFNAIEQFFLFVNAECFCLCCDVDVTTDEKTAFQFSVRVKSTGLLALGFYGLLCHCSTFLSLF